LWWRDGGGIVPIATIWEPSVFCYTYCMETGVTSTRNSVYHCHYHVVVCPKYRRKVLVNGIDERLQVLIQEAVERWEQEFVQVEVMADHIHLLVGCDPQFGIHRFVKFIKEATSHERRKEFPELKKKLPSMWTTSDSVGTTGGVTLETVKKYVEGQKGK
jgi:putative transposase